MDNTLLDKSQEAVANLPQHINSLFLGPLVALFDVLGEVPITEFLNNVVIFGALHDIVEHNNIFGMQFLEDLDLVLECSLEIVVVVDWIERKVLFSLGRILTATRSWVCSRLPM